MATARRGHRPARPQSTRGLTSSSTSCHRSSPSCRVKLIYTGFSAGRVDISHLFGLLERHLTPAPAWVRSRPVARGHPRAGPRASGSRGPWNPANHPPPAVLGAASRTQTDKSRSAESLLRSREGGRKGAERARVPSTRAKRRSTACLSSIATIGRARAANLDRSGQRDPDGWITDW